MYAGGGEGLGKEGVQSDEVASAVAAVSDEIGDILKDELGDAERVDRIGAELADLSAELGLLAGLADGEQQQDFPSLFEIAVNEFTKMDTESLMQRLLHLESKHNIKRVGIFDNRIVHIEFAKFWSMTLDRKTFLPAPWITLYGTLRHEI